MSIFNTLLSNNMSSQTNVKEVVAVKEESREVNNADTEVNSFLKKSDLASARVCPKLQCSTSVLLV